MSDGRLLHRLGARHLVLLPVWAVRSTVRLRRMRRLIARGGFAAAIARAEADARRPVRARLDARDVAAVVHRTASLMPSRPTCLPRSLVVWSLTTSLGQGTELRIGAAPRASGADDGLKAHAWVELDGRPLAEPNGVERFIVLPLERLGDAFTGARA